MLTIIQYGMSKRIMSLNVPSNSVEVASYPRRATTKRRPLPKSLVRKCRFSPAELKRVEKAALSCNLPVATYMRRAIITAPEERLEVLIRLELQRRDRLIDIFGLLESITLILNYTEMLPRLMGSNDIRYIRARLSRVIATLAKKEKHYAVDQNQI